MKRFLIIGLGNFGSALAKRLTELGHEVFAIDSDEHKVENIKNDVTHAITLECTEESILRTLPLHEIDYAIVAIGEDFADSILATALLKKLNVKNIISRATSSIHKTILEALGLPEENIITPEQESAERLVIKLTMKNILNYLNISQEFAIIEVEVPPKYFDKKLKDTDFRQKFNLNVITVKRKTKDFKKQLYEVEEYEGVLTGEYKFKPGDIAIIFGHVADIKNWYNHNVEDEFE